MTQPVCSDLQWDTWPLAEPLARCACAPTHKPVQSHSTLVRLVTRSRYRLQTLGPVLSLPLPADVPRLPRIGWQWLKDRLNLRFEVRTPALFSDWTHMSMTSELFGTYTVEVVSNATRKSCSHEYTCVNTTLNGQDNAAPITELDYYVEA